MLFDEPLLLCLCLLVGHHPLVLGEKLRMLFGEHLPARSCLPVGHRIFLLVVVLGLVVRATWQGTSCPASTLKAVTRAAAGTREAASGTNKGAEILNGHSGMWHLHYAHVAHYHMPPKH